jgi:hypothetical protein
MQDLGLAFSQIRLIYWQLDNIQTNHYNLYMGQFEYSVDLSPVRPEDIDRVAKEYKEKQERDRVANEANSTRG